MEFMIVMLIFGTFSASSMVFGRVKKQVFSRTRHMCRNCGLYLESGRSICPVCGTYLTRTKH